jgi:hydroxyacylglutathione hydrolase
MNDYDFLSYKKLGPTLYRVQESYLDPDNLFNIYVVTGQNKTLIFDSGLGVTNSLRSFIEQNISDKKPMLSYATHGDLDHIGSAILFDEAYLNHRDLRKLDWNLNVERRFSDLGVFCNNNTELINYCRSRYVHNENIVFKDVDDGDQIDAGDIKFDVIAVPCHSAGSLIYYNRKDNYALVGDAISSYNAMQRCTDFSISLATYERFLRMINNRTVLYNGHAPEPVPQGYLIDMIQAMKELINGQTADDEKISGWKFPMVDPEELQYDLHLHKTGQIVINYNAKVLSGYSKGEL